MLPACHAPGILQHSSGPQGLRHGNGLRVSQPLFRRTGDFLGYIVELIPTLHELVELVEGIVETFRALANRGTP